jgi:hypothetical protein
VERGRLLVFLKIAILCLLAGTAAGISLLTAVFLLPTSAMQAHVTAYAREGLSGESANSFLSRIWEQRESFTDAIILQNATEDVPGKNAYERAMMVYRYDL